MALHGKLFDQYEEITGTDQFMLQNKKLLKIQMQYGPVWARSGSMVAYQGDIRFKNKGSGGIGKMFKSAVTGEGVDMMEAEAAVSCSWPTRPPTSRCSTWRTTS